jgi:thiamine transport system substrate-binding protein
VQTNGDAGSLTNKLVLTKGSPIADVVYGIDNTFATRALAAGVLAKYRSPAVTTTQYDIPSGADYLTPIDWGDVCVNVDDAWFSKHNLTPPATLDDLIKPAYKHLFVAPGAATSSPGFAFLLATIAKYGDNGWQPYWKKLMSNGLKLTSGWSDAFEVDYTAGGGNGDRPIVVSYNSDPVFSIPKGGTTPTTHALLDTCFQQVEYAGVLAGAKNPAGAEAFINFLASRPFQESLPDNMYVFPVDPGATLPAAWAKWAKPATNPLSVPAAQITANRQEWLTQWSDITS